MVHNDMKDENEYYTVVIKCFSFDTYAKAEHFMGIATDKLCEMRESREIGFISKISKDSDCYK